MNNKGFTLIEVLISIAILSIILSIAVYSLKYSLNILNILKLASTQNTITLSFFRDSIHSLFFYLWENEKTKNLDNKFNFFFKGNNNSITFITLKSITGKKESLYIQNIFYKNGNLYLKEFPVYNSKVNYKLPEIPTNVVQKLLIKDISNFKIKYFTNKWQDRIENEIPHKIKISYVDKKSRKFQLIFKPESDFYIKKEINIYLFKPM